MVLLRLLASCCTELLHSSKTDNFCSFSSRVRLKLIKMWLKLMWQNTPKTLICYCIYRKSAWYLLLSLSALLMKDLSSWLEVWMASFSLVSSPNSLLRSRDSFRCLSRSCAHSWSSLWASIRSLWTLISTSSASCNCRRRPSNCPDYRERQMKVFLIREYYS